MDAQLPGALSVGQHRVNLGRDAMPVILPGDETARRLWLLGEWDRAKALLAPYSSSLMLER